MCRKAAAVPTKADRAAGHGMYGSTQACSGAASAFVARGGHGRQGNGPGERQHRQLFALQVFKCCGFCDCVTSLSSSARCVGFRHAMLRILSYLQSRGYQSESTAVCMSWTCCRIAGRSHCVTTNVTDIHSPSASCVLRSHKEIQGLAGAAPAPGVEHPRVLPGVCQVGHQPDDLQQNINSLLVPVRISRHQ